MSGIPQYPGYVKFNPICRGSEGKTGLFRLIVKKRGRHGCRFEHVLEEYLTCPPIAAVTLSACFGKNPDNVDCTVFAKEGLKFKDVMKVVKDVEEFGEVDIYLMVG